MEPLMIIFPLDDSPRYFDSSAIDEEYGLWFWVMVVVQEYYR